MQNLKNEDNLKNEEDLKNEDYIIVLVEVTLYKVITYGVDICCFALFLLLVPKSSKIVKFHETESLRIKKRVRMLPKVRPHLSLVWLVLGLNLAIQKNCVDMGDL